jgi:hypothetical protein
MFRVNVMDLPQILAEFAEGRMRGRLPHEIAELADRRRVTDVLTRLVNGTLPPPTVYTDHTGDQLFAGDATIAILAGALLPPDTLTRLGMTFAPWFTDLKIGNLAGFGPAVVLSDDSTDPHLLPMSSACETMPFLRWARPIEKDTENPEISARVMERAHEVTTQIVRGTRIVVLQAPKDADLGDLAGFLAYR